MLRRWFALIAMSRICFELADVETRVRNIQDINLLRLCVGHRRKALKRRAAPESGGHDRANSEQDTAVQATQAAAGDPTSAEHQRHTPEFATSLS